MPLETIDSKAVKNLVDAQAIEGAVVLGQPGGWAVVVRYGNHERVIAAQRSHRMRLWRNLNTAAAFVRLELHMPQFEVDAEDYDPEANKRERPDAAERQRRMQQAAEHDAWFRAEVQKTLDGIANGTVRMISDEEWKAISERKRAELMRRIAEQSN
ncbi:hypothetical protein [Pelagibacterium xiamenense]|uniref:hypothetical protein n=1 Tax=Pelagibacterium xiamenense TaxID=2901140 RepID=UPI001E2D7417|nr:hypothetical protein [Pelagibacterium xiamenense]MCD7059639.1 hypothetical protein [Pelagibacterium xiamenense]